MSDHLGFGASRASMKAPPKRKGNWGDFRGAVGFINASMKAPPKRKGNLNTERNLNLPTGGLNESPSEKEGKSRTLLRTPRNDSASMKAPPKRKGNPAR